MARRRIWGDLTAAPATFALVALGVAAIYASIVLAAPEAQTWPHAAAVAAQLFLPAALGSAVALCIACRVYPSDGVAWFAAAAIIVGIQSFPALAVPGEASPLAEQAPLPSSIVLGLALLLLVKVSERGHIRPAPIPSGVAIGLFLILLRAAWGRLPDAALGARFVGQLQLQDTPYTQAAACVFLLGVGLLLAATAARRSTLARGHRRIVLTALLWPVPLVLGGLGWTTNPAWSVVAIVCGLASCTMLVSASLDLLWQSICDDHQAVRNLQKQLHTLRNQAREGIEQLHEVKGTIAGIASATDLIRHEQRLTRQHRERLEELLATETARLQRLVHTHATDLHIETTQLDDILRPLVLARRLGGQEVVWIPDDLPVRGDGDDVAEAVNILLNNAAEHSPGAQVRIFVRRGGAELVVADDGPGIAEDLREAIFEWGFRRPGSPGQGVGLAMARRLLAEHDRTLDLDVEHPGTAFVIGLGQRWTEGSHGDASALAG